MRKIAFSMFIVICSYFTSAAQMLTVSDFVTMQPLPGVGVYTGDLSVTGFTNAKGEIDVSPFSKHDSIYFKIIGYKTAGFRYSDIIDRNYKLELEVNDITLDEVVIAANRWEENQIENPNRIEKISMKNVALQNPQTAADMLNTSGYVYIQKSQLGGGSPMLRGFSTNRVLLVVDGVRMNNAIFRSGNLQNVISLDPFAMESAEVLFGPGAVRYGSDAIGGVMDFHTLQPMLKDTASRMLFAGHAATRYSSANDEKTGHFDFNLGFKKIAFTTSFSYSDFDDLEAGEEGNKYFLRPTFQETVNGVDTTIINSDPTIQVGSGYSQYNLMQKITYKPVDGVQIDYGFHYSRTSDVPRYDRLYLDGNDDGILDNAEWYYGPQKWMMNRLGVIHSGTTVIYDQLSFIAAFQNFEESRHDRRFGNARLRNQTETVDAVSFNLDLDKNLNDRLDLFYGVEYIRNQVGSVANRRNIETGETEPTNTRYPDGSTWNATGIYGNLKFRINDKLIANGGLRYTYYGIKSDFDTTLFPFPFTHAENSNGALNGSLGLVYAAKEKLQLYINAASGFRAPNLDDIGKVFESEPGSVVVPNPDLKPEYAYHAEAGVAKIFGNKVKTDLSVYYTLLDNALARRSFSFDGQDSILYDGELSGVQAIQNISKAYVYGVQAGIEISIVKGLALKSLISYQKGEEQSEDSLIYYPKSHVAPLFGSTHLIYKRKKLNMDLYSEYNSKMDFDDLSLNDRNDNVPFAKDDKGLPFVPGWYTLNFKVTYFFNTIFSVDAGVENITDQLYRPFASGISAPGRNFIGALKVRW